MTGYENKEALIDEIRKTYRLFDQEFENVPEANRNIRLDEVDRTPQEMLAYQIGWLTLVMSWEEDELAGKQVITPTPDYKWNQLGMLYQQFYQHYANDSLEELRALFRDKIETWCGWVNGLSDEELFVPGIRRWTVTSANWPMWKWIHINSVAPFRSFRTKIRKWKRNI
ncbi:MAG: ClbS/DfsB family four-helix bundle protein [Sporolactobacillus sp.]|uniref:ClbS/DfsB family four-helix bundle protein n=1 Tax=Sporolactobacillus sp. STSJ-5 TaxID=2965076 RepID=UPI0021028B93|nr:ClbS/DfsB family four-helix bundle protein [Sporolactobacillus sp. STSJ-5]MCQ2009398.1 ClbS/DfsB family four-helix bundle protein [Sporolactobacillus sp. STSJ-5]